MKRIHSLLAIALAGSLSLTGGLVGCKDQSSTPEDKGASQDSLPASKLTPAEKLAQTQAEVEAQAGAAKIGDKAKPLSISEWIKGATAQTPVDVTDGKNIYVVEFWATWCGPCKTSIPHLTQLQKQYQDKGVVFVGISNETPEKVKPFVEEQADKMDYIVALDKENQTHLDYMRAYGQGGIPCAFVVNREGKVAWVGHPMELEEPLKNILAGSYDLKEAVAKDEIRSRVSAFTRLLLKKDPQAEEIGEALLKEIGQNADLLRSMLDAAYSAQNFTLLDKVLAQLEGIDEETAAQVQSIRTQVTSRRLITSYMEAFKTGDAAAQKTVQAQVIDSFKGNPSGLVNFAFQTGMQMKDAAQLAFPLQLLDEVDKGEKDDQMLPTDFCRAAFSYKQGDLQAADAFAQKALDAASDEKVKQRISSYLENLKAAHTPQEEGAEAAPAQPAQ